jgi:hypothetical protein
MVAHLKFTSISNIGVMSKDVATQIDATYPKPRCSTTATINVGTGTWNWMIACIPRIKKNTT